MCESSSSSSSTCSGSCESCAFSSSLPLEARAQSAIAWTAFRVFVLPLLAAVLAASQVSDSALLQLLLGMSGFSIATALLRHLPGARLL